MSKYPAELKYRESHEWVRVEGDVAIVGISWFAQDSLGDVVYVDMPEVGAEAAAGETISEIESVKAVSDIYAPVSGEIVEINEALEGDEESVNTDSYGAGWLFKIKLSDPGELAALLDAAAYTAHCEAQ
ncbi:MAG: glycine cleavage system protein GcvH [Myxococcota bacterium]|nr:glycine cleavage system protein GcvH [Myxococcota bacterium]